MSRAHCPQPDACGAPPHGPCFKCGDTEYLSRRMRARNRLPGWVPQDLRGEWIDLAIELGEVYAAAQILALMRETRPVEVLG
ncbi:hypothetical protein [Methylocella tundrae]|uniref:Uncharacterized protein n=1 Tax=Methylocella tundrae TaxID=227605 RepID=A0A4U8YY20_METTU|nr:hypothetical protein [Methylocella tundrae]WPP05480.1 hypothetical protein SIN04_06560 [Methylocella tundrae]VFU07902.1 protein of unknown function [Methylocella tundrae]